MTNRRNILLGGGITATVPLISAPVSAAADAQVGGRSDEQRINQLLLRYCRAVDTRDEAALTAVFLPNARLTYDLFQQREFTSAAEFARYVINGLSGIASTQHF
jgi:SnoaL-like domain